MALRISYMFSGKCSLFCYKLLIRKFLVNSWIADTKRSFSISPQRVLTKKMSSDEGKCSSSDESDDLDCKFNPPEEYFDTPKLMRRQSTLEDEQRIIQLLQEISEDQEKNVSSWIIENKVKVLVFNYKCFLKMHKEGFLKVLATKYSVDHEKIYKALQQFKEYEIGSDGLMKAQEQLKLVLTPEYSKLFKIIGRLENGVKFLVDLRTDVLDLISQLPSNDPNFIPVQNLNNTLKDLLSLWFSVGFLNLERVTWKSPCEMLQKISEYEAVHPVRSWADLKRRVGSYRRCYVFTHSSMPSEPLVVLHTALCNEIASSIRGIVLATQRMSDTNSISGIFGQIDSGNEDASIVKAAIFYSITSTQKGLQGIELGNYLIKRVVREIQAEFPNANQFSTLSPIPTFKSWFIERIKMKEKDETDNSVLPSEIWLPVIEKLPNGWADLKRIIHTNSYNTDRSLMEALKEPLMKVCAFYLYKDKRRGYALDPVANFHLRNGAVMWRLNWMADMSPRGMTNSCGLMVNYRYYLDDLETNSRNYLENQIINASDQIRKFVCQEELIESNNPIN